MKLFPFAKILLLSLLGDVSARGIPTTSGLVFGHAATNRTGVTEYLGIPYAAPTDGAQRWMPPQPYHSSNVLNASTWVRLTGSSIG